MDLPFKVCLYHECSYNCVNALYIKKTISMYNNFAASSTFIYPWTDTILCGLFDQSCKI